MGLETIARLAARQHGRVSWQQLLDQGLDRHAIQRRLEDGTLYRVHRGVYAVGHPGRSTHADYMAAVLACGDGAVLSHRAAAHLQRLLRGSPPRPEVTVPTTAGRSRKGIVVHRVSTLPDKDIKTVYGIRVTNVPRTLLDLAPLLAPEPLARACHEAWVHHDTTPAIVEACIARNPTKKGAAKLRRALLADVTLSDLESAFLDLLRAHGLPLPRTNIDHRGDKVDCHWPEHDLTIELLSYRFHASRAAFERDVARRRRSNHIAYTYGDIFERPRETAEEIAALLRATTS
jgi:predicted transcriptional regulator of viral defense system